jgi:hypothetical protein
MVATASINALPTGQNITSTTGKLTCSAVALTKTDTTTSTISYSEVAPANYTLLNWNPASNTTTAVRFAGVGHTSHNNTTSVTSVAHYGGLLGLGEKNNATGIDALVIGVEGRVGAKLGNITIAAAITATFNTNTEDAGTIDIAVGVYFAPQADDGHITSKFSVYLADPDYEARSEGPINALSTLKQRSVSVEGSPCYGVYDSTGTPAILKSFNVASLTDNGTGDITVNYTNALAAGYNSIVASTSTGGGVPVIVSFNSTTGFRCVTYSISTLLAADTTVGFNVHGGF